jgi:hypothetical protein
VYILRVCKCSLGLSAEIEVRLAHLVEKKKLIPFASCCFTEQHRLRTSVDVESMECVTVNTDSVRASKDTLTIQRPQTASVGVRRLLINVPFCVMALVSVSKPTVRSRQH